MRRAAAGAFRYNMPHASGWVRGLVIGILGALVAAGCGSAPDVVTDRAPGQANDLPAGSPPILFVHGNGDSSALWITTIWRFESNGYPRDRLFAIDFLSPTARDNDAIAQANRSSTADAMRQLAATVDQILASTKAAKVALVANSRGANTVRNYLKNGGGAATVGWVVLGGGVNHGVFSTSGGSNSEFNGAGAFMTQLNDGAEVVPGVRYLTIRSDKLDKFAQADPAGPALRGATNVVLDGVDHRETAFGARAFVEMYRFLTGKTGTPDIIAEQRPAADRFRRRLREPGADQPGRRRSEGHDLRGRRRHRRADRRRRPHHHDRHRRQLGDAGGEARGLL